MSEKPAQSSEILPSPEKFTPTTGSIAIQARFALGVEALNPNPPNPLANIAENITETNRAGRQSVREVIAKAATNDSWKFWKEKEGDH